MRVLIEFENQPLYFSDPQKIISCFDAADLGRSFAEIEEALRCGFFVAGLLSYEAGYAFEERLAVAKTSHFPLLHFGCFRRPSLAWGAAKAGKKEMSIDEARLNLSFQKYSDCIRRIREHIRAGDVYQITYCLKVLFSFRQEALSLYRALLKRQPVPYPAYLETEAFKILSLSPELFVKKKGCFVLTKPMKGTWQRGRDILDDMRAQHKFRYDEKNRAENIMIADLLRNDLGRVGRRIRAPQLFEVATYRTLFQMTSTVTGLIERDIALYALFKALFPSGSVTGAPKIRAMEIIRGLEGVERKIYTGAIGYITPAKDLFFNIPIRTILLEGGQGEMGIGGGIVWDSTAQGEWAEGLLKARFLTDLARTPFEPVGYPP